MVHCVQKCLLTIKRVTDFHKAHHAQQGQSGETAEAKQHAAERVHEAHCSSIQPPVWECQGGVRRTAQADRYLYSVYSIKNMLKV